LNYLDSYLDRFDKQVARDINKSNLCQIHGVTLLYWTSYMDINILELNKILIRSGLNGFPIEPTPPVTEMKQVKINLSKIFSLMDD